MLFQENVFGVVLLEETSPELQTEVSSVLPSFGGDLKTRGLQKQS